MAYPVLTPTLTAFAAVANTPLASEDADLLADVDVQTRRFVSDFLALKFDATASDTLLPAAVTDATLYQKIKGTTANVGGTARGVVQGTISTPDLRDDAITTAKIAPLAVTAAEIADTTITGAKLAVAPNGVAATNINDDAIATRHLGDNVVTATELSSSASDDSLRAVTTNHIKDDAVTAAKIADGAVGPDQMATGTSAQILVADGSGKFQKVTLSGAATISTSGVLTLSTIGYASIRELTANTVSAGAATALTWHDRGDGTVLPAWTKDWETLAMVTLAAGGKIGLAAGTYIIEASCPGYKIDAHTCKLVRYTSGGGVQETVNGSSELASAAGSDQTRTTVLAKMTFAAGEYFKLQHYATSGEAVDGLGKAASCGATNEVYAIVKIHKVA